MDTSELLYPFDPTGSSPDNLVENERQTINSPGIQHFFYILPKAGPFYANESFEAVLFPSGRTLVEGIDYAFGHEFRAATRSTGIPVYGSIVFYDHRLTGNVRLKYQNVGGGWTIDEQKIAEILTNLTIDPRITTWEQVVEMPVLFPPTAHEWEIHDMVGMSDVKAKLGEISAAILASSGEALAQHIQDDQNPHRTNKEQVGLGLVPNMGLATEIAAGAGTSNTGFMTPRLTQVAITALVLPVINAHANRTDNPHGVTKAQIGLQLVENYPPASREIAEAGVSSTTLLTPLGGRQLFGALNQVFTGHVEDASNPHQTTAAQVGAYSTQQVDSILTNYLTLTGTAANANRVFGMNLTELLENVSQVPMNNALLFNGLSLAQVSALILSGTAADSLKFGGKTYSEFEAELDTMTNGKVDGATVPPVTTVKRLVGTAPDPLPPGYEPTYDIIELDRSYTKIARILMWLDAAWQPSDVSFQLYGGRGYLSTAKTPVGLVTISFDRMLDGDSNLVFQNISVLNVNGAADMKLFYQVVDVIEYFPDPVTQEPAPRNRRYLEIWVEDEKLRSQIQCVDYSGGMVEFLTDPFPEFEWDILNGTVNTQMLQPNGTQPVPVYRAADAVKALLDTTIARVSTLETRATNNESAIGAVSTNTNTRFGQVEGRLNIVEGTLEDLLGYLQSTADHFNGL